MESKDTSNLLLSVSPVVGRAIRRALDIAHTPDNAGVLSELSQCEKDEVKYVYNQLNEYLAS